MKIDEKGNNKIKERKMKEKHLFGNVCKIVNLESNK